ncbi:hypothetical protein ACFO0N_06075 [Halobium salinum]|uniref:Uncharacterized protein n=1 Tax=Halobium salinum TaxID=1364940 RepID=A0ABD5P9D9_9EURY|nr:hypothetical protein [Halobium salinum]
MEPSTPFDRDSAGDSSGSSDSSGGRSRFGLRRRLNGLFSFRTFLFALVLSTVGVVAGGFLAGVVPIPFLGLLGRFVGLFVAAFVVGLVAAGRRYLETGLAGAAAAALSFLLTALGAVFTAWFPATTDLLSQHGPTIAGIGAGSGLLVALLGYYFGRDLRSGLTREIE